MMPHEVSGNSAADVVALADGLMQPGHPLMVLFSHEKEDTEDVFVRTFIESRLANEFVLTFHGERVTSLEEFYDECIRVMPAVASYFGRNLDALAEVLGDRGVALATDSSKGSYWLWNHSDVLFARDPIWFSHLFTVLVSDAQLRSGVRRVQLGRQPRTQPVFPIFTGKWESFAEPLSKPDSFLHRLHYWYNPMHMPDEGTGVRFVKVI